jgi:hypothetical protein
MPGPSQLIRENCPLVVASSGGVGGNDGILSAQQYEELLAGGGGGTLQDAYDGGSTITIADATPIDITCPSDGSPALLLRSPGGTGELLRFSVISGFAATLLTQSVNLLLGALPQSVDYVQGSRATLLAGDGGAGAGGGDASIIAGNAVSDGGSPANGGSVVLTGGTAVHGGTAGGVQILGGSQTDTSTGGTVLIKPGGSTGGTGGDIDILGETSNEAGDITIFAASSVGAFPGGSVSINGGVGGSSNASGGDVSITGGTGTGTSAPGGDVTIAGGLGGVGAFTSFGGDVIIHAGQGTADAGDVKIGLTTTAGIQIGGGTQGIGFNTAPIPRPNLPAAPTAAQIATVLGALGLVNLT